MMVFLLRCSGCVCLRVWFVCLWGDRFARVQFTCVQSAGLFLLPSPLLWQPESSEKNIWGSTVSAFLDLILFLSLFLSSSTGFRFLFIYFLGSDAWFLYFIFICVCKLFWILHEIVNICGFQPGAVLHSTPTPPPPRPGTIGNVWLS